MKNIFVKLSLFLVLALVLLTGCKDFWHPEGPSDGPSSSEYRITFHANGGSGTVPDPITIDIDEDGFFLPNPYDLYREGYSFAGWCVNSNGSGTIYGIWEYFTPSRSLTLYAIWNQIGGIREVTVAMFDSYGDGWDGNGRLRIRINSTTVNSYTTGVEAGSYNTFTFNVTSGDVVRFYWTVTVNAWGNAWQEENSFIVYYTNTPPSPTFTASNNHNWNGTNALIYRLRDTMNNITNGTLLGTFTVP